MRPWACGQTETETEAQRRLVSTGWQREATALSVVGFSVWLIGRLQMAGMGVDEGRRHPVRVMVSAGPTSHGRMHLVNHDDLEL